MDGNLQLCDIHGESTALGKRCQKNSKRTTKVSNFWWCKIDLCRQIHCCFGRWRRCICSSTVSNKARTGPNVALIATFESSHSPSWMASGHQKVTNVTKMSQSGNLFCWNLVLNYHPNPLYWKNSLKQSSKKHKHACVCTCSRTDWEANMFSRNASQGTPTTSLYVCQTDSMLYLGLCDEMLWYHIYKNKRKQKPKDGKMIYVEVRV